MTRRILEYAAPAQFKVYERNSRTHSADQIRQVRRSIDEFGFTNPLLVDERDVLIAGHARIGAALLDPSLAEVPYIRLVGLTKAQKKALVIADNKIAENAGWDGDMLRLELGDLKSMGYDLSLTGFSDLELTAAFSLKIGRTDPDDAPPAPTDPVSKLGDIWLLGPHRVICGDSTNAEVVAKLLRSDKPHLMVTDPPYGVSYDAAWRNRVIRANGTRVAARAVGKVLNDDRADWREAWALFPGRVAYVWHGGLHAATVQESLAAAGFGIRAQIIWVKTRPVIGRSHFHWQHEPVLYGVREEGEDLVDDNWRFVPEHEVAGYAVKEGQTAAWVGGRKQSTVWNIEHIRSETGHSTQKPVECMRRPMTNNSDPGQMIYDPFLGSATSIIAAETSGRICLGVELSPVYVDVGVLRWQQFTGKTATLEGTNQSFDAVATLRLAKRNRPGRDSQHKDQSNSPARSPRRRSQKAETA